MRKYIFIFILFVPISYLLAQKATPITEPTPAGVTVVTTKNSVTIAGKKSRLYCFHWIPAFEK
jgi:hypothetical protein